MYAYYLKVGKTVLTLNWSSENLMVLIKDFGKEKFLFSKWAKSTIDILYSFVNQMELS